MSQRFHATFHPSASSSSRLSPAITFSIPSSHDSTPLDGRIYHPTTSPTTKAKVAVVAHPYAPLAGSYNDPVVLTVASSLLHKGFIVSTFNFRGAGSSAGRTSWSSHPETADYGTIATFVTLYAYYRSRCDVDVVLAGYSYGSLVASQVAPAATLLENASGDVMMFARRTAQETSRSSITLSKLPSGEWRDENQPNTTLERKDEGGVGDIKTTTSYILISPLLPPVSTALSIASAPKSLFSGISSLWSSSSTPTTPSSATKEQNDPSTTTIKEQKQKSKHETLAIYGTNDVFVSISKLRAWAEKRRKAEDPLFTGIEVQGATHFWHEEGDGGGNGGETWLEQMSAHVEMWADEL